MRGALAAAAFVTLAAAAGTPVSAQSPEPPAAKRLRVGISGWENNLTPFTVTFASQPSTVDLLNLVYDTLFWSQASKPPEPWLAESAEPSADRKSWTVKLRPEVKWHDGRSFSAEDVKFTFEYFKQHAGQTGRYGHHVAEVPVFTRAQVLGPEEVRLFFENPVPSFTILPGGDLPMLPKHLWQGIDKPLDARTQKPIGTGPFKMAEMEAPQRYRLEANQDYFKGKPLVDEMEVSVVGDPNVAFNDLAGNKLDFVSRTVPPVFVDQLTANGQLKVVRASRWESVQLNFNARKQPLSDPKLRKAISLSIDNQALVKTVIGGRGRPGVDTFLHPESQWAAPNPQHELHVGKANQILDSAGYSRKDSDGIRRAPDGKRLEFSALFSTLEPQSLHALRLISQMTTAIGVRMEPEPATPARLRSVRRSPPATVPGYDAYVSELEVHVHADPDAFMFFYHSPGKGMGAQITGYSNQSFDRVIESAATTINAAERKRKLIEAQAIFAEELPSLVLFYPDGVYAFRPAAYDGWKADPGHGIFTKRSLLQGYANPGGLAEEEDTLPPAWVFLGGVAAMILIGSGVVLLRRRPAKAARDSLDLQGDPRAGPESTPDDSAAIGGVQDAADPAAIEPAAEEGAEEMSAGEATAPSVPEAPAALSLPPVTGPPDPSSWPGIPERRKDGPVVGRFGVRPPVLPPLPAPQDLSQTPPTGALPPLSGPSDLLSAGPSRETGPSRTAVPEAGDIEDAEEQGAADPAGPPPEEASPADR